MDFTNVQSITVFHNWLSIMPNTYTAYIYIQRCANIVMDEMINYTILDLNTCISSYFAINFTLRLYFSSWFLQKIFWNCTSSTMSLQNLSNNAICFLKNLIWKSLNLKVNVVFLCKYLTFNTIWRNISRSIILGWYYRVTKMS